MVVVWPSSDLMTGIQEIHGFCFHSFYSFNKKEKSLSLSFRLAIVPAGSIMKPMLVLQTENDAFFVHRLNRTFPIPYTYSATFLYSHIPFSVLNNIKIFFKIILSDNSRFSKHFRCDFVLPNKSPPFCPIVASCRLTAVSQIYHNVSKLYKCTFLRSLAGIHTKIERIYT